jgi:hypothetical protein
MHTIATPTTIAGWTKAGHHPIKMRICKYLEWDALMPFSGEKVALKILFFFWFLPISKFLQA